MSRVPHPRRCVAAVVLLLLTVLGVTSASGAPAPVSAADRAVAASARAQAVQPGEFDPKFGIRAPEVAPGGNFNAPETVYDALQNGSGAYVARAKTTVTLPKSVILTYVRTCGSIRAYRPDDNSPYFQQFCCPDPDNTSTCDSDLVVQTPATDQDNAPFDPTSSFGITWARSTGPIWAASPRGSSRPYGIFPKARVRLLAFGSLPVTATVQLTQPVSANGAVQPLQYFDLVLSPPPAGTRVEGYPYPLGDTDNYIAKRTLSGVVDVHLSDVEVDGRPVEVGSGCVARSAKLAYSAPRGTFTADTLPSQRGGRADEFDALNGADPGTANAKLTIPAFAGCRDGNRRLDPLVSNLASGLNRVQLKLTVGANSCGADTNPLKGCPNYPGYSDGPILAPLRALSKILSKLPAASARHSAAGLPAALRAKLPAKYR